MKYSWNSAKNCDGIGLKEMRPRMKGVTGRLESLKVIDHSVKSEDCSLRNVARQ